MEEMLKKIVNLGIGAVKVLEANLETTFRRAEEGVSEMIAKGDSASDETSVRVKQFVDELLGSVKDYENKAKELTESLVATLKEIDPTGEKVGDLDKKIDDLQKKVDNA